MWNRFNILLLNFCLIYSLLLLLSVSLFLSAQILCKSVCSLSRGISSHICVFSVCALICEVQLWEIAKGQINQHMQMSCDLICALDLSYPWHISVIISVHKSVSFHVPPSYLIVWSPNKYFWWSAFFMMKIMWNPFTFCWLMHFAFLEKDPTPFLCWQAECAVKWYCTSCKVPACSWNSSVETSHEILTGYRGI